MLEKVRRRVEFAYAYGARTADRQVLRPMHGHIVPSAVATVYLFVIDPLLPAVAVRGDLYSAFAALALDYTGFQNAT